MFRSIAQRTRKDRDYADPNRLWDLMVLRRVLDGTLYDALPYDFHDERNDRTGEYIPLRLRAPSVRYNLCRLVVEDSVALLFGEGRFPAIETKDEATREALAALVKETHLNQIMFAAAVRGAVGSVVLRMRVLNGRVFFDVMDTLYLTPVWDPQAPDTLLRVEERYKVRGDVLAAQGYQIEAGNLRAEHWFQRIWDAQAETWFLPWPVREVEPSTPQVDERRTVRHSLGFVPMVWVRNLPGGTEPEGACTFRAAIETQIEVEYQLSQAGRGLKYSSDPTLLIKEPAGGDDGAQVGGAANALVVSEKGDAKLLEINGTASAAVIEYVRTLREMALESIHGNRSSADRLTAAQSGRALELMNQGLIWLADNLRISYGEDALLSLMRMVVAASQKMTLSIAGQKVTKLNAAEPLTLRWPAWYAPTYRDRVEQAESLRTLTDAGILSHETATGAIAATYDIEDADAERALIAKEQQAAMDAEIEMHAQVQAKTTADGAAITARPSRPAPAPAASGGAGKGTAPPPKG